MKEQRPYTNHPATREILHKLHKNVLNVLSKKQGGNKIGGDEALQRPALDPSSPNRAPTLLQATSVPRIVPMLARKNATTVSLAVDPSLQNTTIFRHVPLAWNFDLARL